MVCYRVEVLCIDRLNHSVENNSKTQMNLTFFAPSGVIPALVRSSYEQTNSTTSPLSSLITSSQVITYVYLRRTCPPGSSLLYPLGAGIVPSIPVSKKSSRSMYTAPVNGISLVPSSTFFGCFSAVKISTLSTW